MYLHHLLGKKEMQKNNRKGTNDYVVLTYVFFIISTFSLITRQEPIHARISTNNERGKNKFSLFFSLFSAYQVIELIYLLS